MLLTTYFFKTPNPIGISGQTSLTSKINFAMWILIIIYPDSAIVRGIEVAKTISISFNLIPIIIYLII